MEPIKIDAFKLYRMPLSLKASRSGRLAFIIRQANVKNNCYDQDIHLLHKGKLRQMTHRGDVTAFWWADDKTIWFTRRPAPRKGKSNADSKKTAGNTPETVLYRLSADAEAPGKGEKHLVLPFNMQELAPLGDGRFLFTGTCAKKPLPHCALRRDEADYEIVTGLPIWENGAGFVGGNKSRLYLFDGKKAHVLTDENTNVSGIQTTKSVNFAFFFASIYDKVMPVTNHLFRLDLRTHSVEDLSVMPAFDHQKYAIVSDDELVVYGTDQKRHGINQNGAFFKTHAPWTSPACLYDGGEYGGWASVGSDVVHPAESVWSVCGGTLYWLSTIAERSSIMTIDINSGAIYCKSSVINAVFEFCISPRDDGVYFTALDHLNGMELYKLSKSGKITCLSSLNHDTNGKHALSSPVPFCFPNATGDSIHGFVMKPAGFKTKDSKQYPAVLYIHGGPKIVYGSVLFHELQYLAAKGFAVLFANPTGSDGRGDVFADIRGQYGGPDYDDLMQFVDEALAANPWIDKSRLGVTGGSYGGFMVNWIIGHTTRFAAAVSQRSISNWSTMANLSDIGYYFEPDQAGATTWEDPARIWAHSPLKYADKVKTPTLFIHSDEDYRCPLPEALQMYTALKLFGVDTRLCIFHGENHELSRSGKPRHRIARIAEITGWFEKYLCSDQNPL